MRKELRKMCRFLLLAGCVGMVAPVASAATLVGGSITYSFGEGLSVGVRVIESDDELFINFGSFALIVPEEKAYPMIGLDYSLSNEENPIRLAVGAVQLEGIEEVSPAITVSFGDKIRLGAEVVVFSEFVE